jgi:uncharacterized repeat protein (TIGR01451 family)
LGTAIGPTGVGGNLQDISVRSDDAVFGTIGGSFFSFDATGAGTFVGTLGTGFQTGHGIAYDPADDTLFHAWSTFGTCPGTDIQLDTINDTTGASTFAVDLLYPDPGDDCPRANAMDFLNGTLFASHNDNFGGTRENFLSTIDTGTGDVTIVGETQDGLDALASAAAFADVEVVKEVSATTALTGQPLVYTLTVTNNGVADATNVIVTDTLPAAFEADTITASVGGCTGTTTITCSLGDIAAGDSETITISGEAVAGAALSNTATVTTDVSDVNPANNSDTVDSASATVTVSVTPTSASVASGATTNFTATVTVTAGSVDEPVAMDCLVLSGPVVITCDFPDLTIVVVNGADIVLNNTIAGPGTGSANVTVAVRAISNTGVAGVGLPPTSANPQLPLYAVWLGLPALAFFALLLFSGRQKRVAFALATALLVVALLPLAGCGGGEDAAAPLPQTVTFRIRAVIGTHAVSSQTVTLTVN